MVVITEDHFDNYTSIRLGGTVPIRRFTIENSKKVSVQVITYGATVTSIKCPDKRGVVRDVVAGFTDIRGYLKEDYPKFGVTLGRAANYIKSAQFQCVDEIVELSKNAGEHHFNGGVIGFDRIIWQPYVEGDMLVFSYNSQDQEEGYPGNLVVNILFELTESNEFTIHYKARTTKATYVNMTNYTHFNLAGFYLGSQPILTHTLCLHADKIIVKTPQGLPTGDLSPVVATPLDFQIPKAIGKVIHKVHNGFDHHLAITKSLQKDNTFVGRLYYPENGRAVEFYSNYSSVHLCTGTDLPEQRKFEKKQPIGDVKRVSGKGYNYYKNGSVCLAPQNFPDSPNHDNFPDPILLPGVDYYKFIKYKFLVKK